MNGGNYAEGQWGRVGPQTMQASQDNWIAKEQRDPLQHHEQESILEHNTMQGSIASDYKYIMPISASQGQFKVSESTKFIEPNSPLNVSPADIYANIQRYGKGIP